MRSGTLRYRLLLGVLLAMSLIDASLGQTPGAGPLVVEAKIPLGPIEGRMDHLAYDTSRSRIYLAELENNTIGIVDLKANRLLRTVPGFKEPQGIAYDAALDTVYVASRGDGSLRLLNGRDFAPITTVPLGEDADNVRLDPSAHRVYVGVGDGALAVVDSTTRKRTGEILLKGHPESFQLDPASPKIFVNVPDAGHIAVVSRDSGEQIAAWDTGELHANYPMALDTERNRLLSIFRQPARLQAYEMASGRKLASVEICGDSDDVFIDGRRRRVYVICGSGHVETLDSETYAQLGRLTTTRGSRTGLFVPDIDRLIVAIRASGSEGAALWVLRPAP